jgi:protein-S-isoprenylcysteine O-methyltransferase Ste14
MNARFPFPPGIPLIALLLAWALGKVWPVLLHWPAWTRWAGWCLVVAPFFVFLWAVATFRRHHTVVNPRGEVTTIVTVGPFRYTRNPMYVSLLVLYVGATLGFRLAWAAILLVPVFLTLHYFVVIPEERYLRAAFGERYSAYAQRVRRWL